MVSPIEVELLVAPGCESRGPVLEAIHRVAAQNTLTPLVRETVVSSPEEAIEKRFLGSPSVRVGGEDVEPGARWRTDYGLG